MGMRGLLLVMSAVGLLSAAGCRSAVVEATVVNRLDRPIRLIEVDYPSASFGTENLGVGAEYHYRFKVLGSGEMRVIYTDAGEKEHTVKGPALREGAQGRLGVAIGPGGVDWQMQGVEQP